MTFQKQLLARPFKKASRPSLPFMNGGASLLLAVLLILVLVVLSLLTLSTARNNLEYAHAMAEKNTQYYEACNQSEQILAQVSRILTDEINYQIPGDFTGLDVICEEDLISWEVPINQRQTLSVAVSRFDCRVIRWQVVPAAAWIGDDSFSVPEFEKG